MTSGTVSYEVQGLDTQVRFQCDCPDFWEQAVSHLVLPGWKSQKLFGISSKLSVQSSDDGYVLRDEGLELRGEASTILPRLASLLHHRLAESSELVVVHAGAVEYQGRVILFPGRSYAGKSRLTQAFVQAGFRYYSDEYAVLSPKTGRVSAFPRGLHLRRGDKTLISAPPSQEQQSAQLGAVFFLQYEENAELQLERLSRSQTVVKLFENTVAAQRLGHKALSLFENITQKTQAWSGQRGEAEQTVSQIRKLLDKSQEPS